MTTKYLTRDASELSAPVRIVASRSRMLERWIGPEREARTIFHFSPGCPAGVFSEVQKVQNPEGRGPECDTPALGSSGRGRSPDRIVDLRDGCGGVFNLHDQTTVGFVLQVDHDGLVSVAMHVVEPDPRQVDARYSPPPPQCVLDLRVCFRALHMF